MNQHKKTNITLIGMPSSGKSTVGVLLAKRLAYSFVDVDIVIQEKEGRLLKDIIAEQGMDGFMEVENRINAELDVRRSVIDRYLAKRPWSIIRKSAKLFI